jgi:anti-anti-sigma factor
MQQSPTGAGSCEGPPLRLIPPAELDPSTAPELEALILDLDPTTEAIVDFADVDFCDSSGLRVLVDAYKRFDKNGGSLRVANPRAHVRRLFELTALDERMIIEVD